jgi:hypothetical protein
VAQHGVIQRQLPAVITRNDKQDDRDILTANVQVCQLCLCLSPAAVNACMVEVCLDLVFVLARNMLGLLVRRCAASAVRV